MFGAEEAFAAVNPRLAACIILTVFVPIFMLGARHAAALVAESLGFRLVQDSWDGGEGSRSSAGFRMHQAAVGQPVAYGTDAVAALRLHGGVVQPPVLVGTGEGEVESDYHSADQNQDNALSLSELLRIVQFYNSGGFHCAAPNDPQSEDGYLPGANPLAQNCAHHSSDYAPQDWNIDLGELLRAIQFFNIGGYYRCDENTEDGFCPGTP